MASIIQDGILKFINSKRAFMEKSNFSRSMIDNVVYVKIDFSDMDSEILGKISDIVKENTSFGVSTDDDGLKNYLLWSGYAIKTPKIDTEYDLKYLNNDRLYSFYKSTDSNVEVSFLEDGYITIRRIFKLLRDEILPDSKYYFKDVAIPKIRLYYPAFNTDDSKIICDVYEDCIPISLEGHVLDNRNNQSLKLTDVTIVYKKFKIENIP